MSLKRDDTCTASSKRKRTVVVLTSLITATGCTSQYRIPDSQPVSSQAKAGTVLIAPTLVAPWDDVSSLLKPNFQLTGDQALSKVLPTTETISEQVLSAFGASLAAGLPTTTISSKRVIGGDSPGLVKTIDKETGVAPAITNTLPSAVSLPDGVNPGATLGLDPILQYKAANYLLQEVQLLNSGIENAARRSCSVAYVVTLKLAVMNYRPRLPYSVHSHIGFAFNGNFASYSQAATGGKDIPKAHSDLAPECDLGQINPSVIPLLVADDVQVALKSRAAEAAAQIAFGLSGLASGIGIAANANSLQQSLTAITNHDLTSTLTIGRESENSIYALISPNNQASDQASLASQTYDVTVLLLVPRSYFGRAADPQSPTIAVTSYTEYRDAKSGEVLPDTSDYALAAGGDRILVPFLDQKGRNVWAGLDPFEKAAEIRRLTLAVEMADPSGFSDVLSCNNNMLSTGKPSRLCSSHKSTLLHVPFPPLFWTRMGTLLDYSRDKLSLFQARLPARISVPQQQVLLADDGTHPIQAVLGGVHARSVSRLSASLRVTPFDKDSWGSLAPVDIPAQTLTLNEAAHTLTLTFPSLKKLNITCLSPEIVPPKPQAPVSTAKPDKDPPAASNKSADLKCPSRTGSAGSEARPNAILLALDNCDPGNQLCPALTDTTITESRAVQLKLERLRNLRMLLQENSLFPQTDGSTPTGQDFENEFKDFDKQIENLQSKIAKLKNEIESSEAKICCTFNASEPSDKVNKQLAAKKDLEDLREKKKNAKRLQEKLAQIDATLAALNKQSAALANEEDAAAAAATAKPAEQAARDAALLAARTQSAHARTAVLDASRIAHLDTVVRDYAMLAVSLTQSAESTSASTITLSNYGTSVSVDPVTHAGKIVVTIMGVPAADTIAVSVTGAGLESVTDQSNTVIPPDLKKGFVLPKVGVYTFKLSGITPGVPVNLTVQALKDNANDGENKTLTFIPSLGSVSVPVASTASLPVN